MAGLNDRQRRFVELVAAGTPAGRAYEQAGYSQRGDSADQAASKALKEPHMAGYLESLRADSREKAGIERDELVRDLVTIWKAKPSEASMGNPLCDLVMTKAGPVALFPPKMQAAERLVKLLGWDKPGQLDGKLEINVTIGGDA